MWLSVKTLRVPIIERAQLSVPNLLSQVEANSLPPSVSSRKGDAHLLLAPLQREKKQPRLPYQRILNQNRLRSSTCSCSGHTTGSFQPHPLRPPGIEAAKTKSEAQSTFLHKLMVKREVGCGTRDLEEWRAKGRVAAVMSYSLSSCTTLRRFACRGQQGRPSQRPPTLGRKRRRHVAIHHQRIL